MRKLTYIVAFILTFALVDNVKSTPICTGDILIQNAPVNKINLNEGKKNKSVKIDSDIKIDSILLASKNGSCTVTIEASIGYNQSYAKVKVSATAETCQKALDEALSSLKEAKKALEKL